MTDRRTFLAASLVAPAIVTLHRSQMSAVTSPPPVPRHERETSSSVPTGEPDGVLAFTGRPIDKEVEVGLAAIAVGVVTAWAALKDPA